MAEEGALAAQSLERLDMAAILLMTLGEESAATLMQHMGPKEVQRVGLAMAQLGTVRNEDVEHVMTTMLGEVESLTGLGMSSDAYIRNTLIKALGSEKAGALIDRILIDNNTRGLDTLKWMDPRSVAEIIRYEHPQIQAIVLAHLDPDHAAGVLGNFTDARARLDIMMRVATLERVQPAALQELNHILERQFAGTSTQVSKMGGAKAAADIMNNVEGGIGQEIMESISEINEDLGTKIQDLMFIFDNLQEVDDRGIQMLLREVSSDVLILALKGADELMQEKIFKNMSRRAAELLKDDLDAKGPVRLSEVEGAQKEILTIARKLAEAGEIVLGGGGEQML